MELPNRSVVVGSAMGNGTTRSLLADDQVCQRETSVKVPGIDLLFLASG